MNNYIQKGKTLTVALTAAVTSGQLVLLGNSKLPAVATGTYAANVAGEYQLSGVFELPADGPSAGVVGDLAYWDTAAGDVTSTAAGNTKIGVYASPKVANDLTARVRLTQLS